MDAEIVLTAQKMQSEALGIYVRDEATCVATKLVELRPYIEELWKRFEHGETILGCTSKTEFCKNVLNRSIRAVRYMLHGGNPDNAKRGLQGEIISPRTAECVERIRSLGDFVLAAMIVEQARLLALDSLDAALEAASMEGKIVAHLCRVENDEGMTYEQWLASGESSGTFKGKTWAQRYGKDAGTDESCEEST